MTFELLEHPADLGFRASGESLEDLFAHCAHALLSIILDPSTVVAQQSWEMTAEGGDLESLLVNWLNEVLYFIDTKGAVFSTFAISFPMPMRVICEAWGQLRDPVQHAARLSVKAVTYHQLKVSQEQETWVAEVYVDV